MGIYSQEEVLDMGDIPTDGFALVVDPSTGEYGIKSPQELAEAIRRMKPLDLAPFCATPEKTKEDKAS